MSDLRKILLVGYNFELPLTILGSNGFSEADGYQTVMVMTSRTALSMLEQDHTIVGVIAADPRFQPHVACSSKSQSQALNAIPMIVLAHQTSLQNVVKVYKGPRTRIVLREEIGTLPATLRELLAAA